ncbi:uncharacterized protein LOC144159458 [Haemaphysalis longicornis]
MDSSTPTSSTPTAEVPADGASGIDVIRGYAELMGESLDSVMRVLADDGDEVEPEPGPADEDSSAELEDGDWDDLSAEVRLHEWLMDHRAVVDLLNTLNDLRPLLHASFNREDSVEFGRPELKPEE